LKGAGDRVQGAGFSPADVHSGFEKRLHATGMVAPLFKSIPLHASHQASAWFFFMKNQQTRPQIRMPFHQSKQQPYQKFCATITRLLVFSERFF
jgi:hypothetical protein